MTIECKDLEWFKDMYISHHYRADGLRGLYRCMKRGATYRIQHPHFKLLSDLRFDSLSKAQAAANDHNKQQFQAIIEEWRKG